MDKQKVAVESKIRVKKQKQYLKGYFSAKGMYKSLAAMKIAMRYHSGERKGGQPEISHQFELVSYGLPLFEQYGITFTDIMISALLLHDTIEDYYEQGMIEMISEACGEEVIILVSAVTKWDGFKKVSEDYIRYYNQISLEKFAIIVKMIDRLHNLESMLEASHIFDKKKRIKYLSEVKNFIIPVAKKERQESPEYYQLITFLIRELNTYIKFIERINELDI